ncbi:MAG: hypothetical protein AUH30_05780 [Candidatus Rokubacteria bacterium 13_1_40CM_68_15]|nr:MAG: hypothetical protein AUH30_05780 [Candidatus Rokubacteria bacterium 13_1_40CM_68_15]
MRRRHIFSLLVVAVPAVDALGELLPLFWREHVGDIGERLSEALRRVLGQLQLICPKRLERGPIDVLLRQQLDRLPARVVYPRPHRQQIVRSPLHDRGKLLLLRLSGFDLDVQVLERAVEMRVQRRGIERGTLTVAMAARQKKRRRGLLPPEVEGGEVCVVSLMAAAPFPDGALENVSRRRKVSAPWMNRLSPPGKVR